MAKSLIITEKPSVAQEFARILGVSGRNDGYIENDKYVITWCVGHLVEMVYPEEYDEKYKRWRLEDLPFLPEEYKYNVIHNENYHDYPSYNGSYTRSLATVENILKTTPSDIIMDVHRDAVGSRSDYAPTVKIGDTDEAAQIMFVIGTNEGGLWHPNWNQNLKFAIKIQEKAEEMYP